jgi:hypothetical protein
MEQMPKKQSVYNKERYEQNREEISKYRRERYRTMHKKDLNIKVRTGTFTLIKFCFCLYNKIMYVMYVIIGKQNCIQCD